jgi:hypothetical protein
LQQVATRPLLDRVREGEEPWHPLSRFTIAIC